MFLSGGKFIELLLLGAEKMLGICCTPGVGGHRVSTCFQKCFFYLTRPDLTRDIWEPPDPSKALVIYNPTHYHWGVVLVLTCVFFVVCV